MTNLENMTPEIATKIRELKDACGKTAAEMGRSLLATERYFMERYSPAEDDLKSIRLPFSITPETTAQIRDMVEAEEVPHSEEIIDALSEERHIAESRIVIFREKDGSIREVILP